MFVSERNTKLEQQATSAAELEEPPVPAATASNVQRLVDEGWTLVADDPKAAAQRFRAALALTPRDGAASYGLGYALLRAGDEGEATRHLCRAKSYADRDTSREVANLLEHEGLVCP
jgi:Flp pilus assembly protein TadD